jgi:hypothetical protein
VSRCEVLLLKLVAKVHLERAGEFVDTLVCEAVAGSCGHVEEERDAVRLELLLRVPAVRSGNADGDDRWVL